MRIDHVGTITQTTNLRPFHVQCSCGTAGDFSEKDAAVAYVESHFAKLSGISTHELVDKSDVVETEKPVPPLANAASVPIPDELSPVEGQAGEIVDPSAQVSADSVSHEASWPKKKRK